MNREVDEFSVIREQFEQRIKRAGMRNTPERLAVLDAIYKSDTMLGVRELLYRIEQQRFRISRATLYNVLDLLCDWGYVVRMQLNEGFVVYGKADSAKPQLVLQCVSCGKLSKVESPIWQALIEDCHKECGFVWENQKVLVRGLCNKCKKD